jgi:hypothetical protein
VLKQISAVSPAADGFPCRFDHFLENFDVAGRPLPRVMVREIEHPFCANRTARICRTLILHKIEEKPRHIDHDVSSSIDDEAADPMMVPR